MSNTPNAMDCGGKRSATPLWYFTEADHISRLREVAQTWLGTPFHAHGRIKGRGVSCQTLVELIYREVGFAPHELTIPTGSLKHFRSTRESLVAAHVDTHCRHFMEPVPFPDGVPLPWPGDMLCFHFSTCEHSAIALPGRTFIHAMIHVGVTISSLDDATYAPFLKRIWRPLAGAQPPASSLQPPA